MSIVNVNFFPSFIQVCKFYGNPPIDKRSVDGEKRRNKDKPFKTLYLLHGIYGDDGWLTGSRIKRWAQAQSA